MHERKGSYSSLSAAVVQAAEEDKRAGVLNLGQEVRRGSGSVEEDIECSRLTSRSSSSPTGGDGGGGGGGGGAKVAGSTSRELL